MASSDCQSLTVTDPQLESFDATAIVLCDELGITLREERNLLLDLTNVLLRILEVDLLDGYDFLGNIMNSSVYL